MGEFDTSQQPNLAQLMMLPGANTPGGSPLPAASPVQAQDPDAALKQQMLNASQLGQQSYKEQMGRAHDLASQIAALQQQQTEAAQNAPTPWSPHYDPVTGVGSFLKDAGKGLLQALSLTRPGQGIENALYMRKSAPYREQQSVRAQQIADLQKQQEAEEKPLEAAAQLQYKPYMAAAAGERASAAMLTAQSRQAYDKAMVPIRQQLADIEAKYKAGQLTAEDARTKASILIGQGHDSAMRAVGSMYSDQRDRDTQIQAGETEFKTETESWFQRLTGLGPTPPSQQPTAPPGPKARGSAVTPRSTAPPGRAQRFTDNGVTYNIPADKVAAFKKDHPNAR